MFGLNNLLDLWEALVARLEAAGKVVPALALRAIMFWEFWESGVEKLKGENWFADLPWAEWQIGFPYPFSALPMDINWFAATWGELIFAVMILLGVFTRFAAFSLIVITVVATAAVHFPVQWDGLDQLWQGYVISADDFGNFKLPLLFVVMLLPLVFNGGGTFSVDHLLSRMLGRGDPLQPVGDLLAWSLAFVVLGVVFVFLIPMLGYALLATALAGSLVHRFIV